MKILNYIKNNVVFFDGGMGTLLQEKGYDRLPETLNFSDPSVIAGIHREYVVAGADIITTNTFNSISLKLKQFGIDTVENIKAAIELAKSAGPKFIVLGLGSLGKLIEPTGELTFDEAYELFIEELVAAEDKTDAILLETCSDLAEAKAFCLACKEHSKLPFFVTMTYTGGRTFLGVSPQNAAITLAAFGVSALGVNCSAGPLQMFEVVSELLNYSKVPVIVQPNAGLPKILNGKTIYDIAVKDFCDAVTKMIDKGVAIVGGCCGTTPKFIRELVRQNGGKKRAKTQYEKITAVTSATQVVNFSLAPIIIGERINPTGKKLMADALRSGNLSYILDEAIAQSECGAQILDVNCGLPDVDEKTLLKQMVKEICEVCFLPLQLDSSDHSALENAARYYVGKPILNSVNGKAESLKAVFPIAKKYGAAVIGLTMDENGIPAKAEGRLEIARKIINEAKKYGIDKEDIIIDCLALTAASSQPEIKETLKAIGFVKKLGVKTLLGVSNISFGLPNRPLLNSVYLSLALNSGLDACIIDPLSIQMTETIRAYNVLNNTDVDAEQYIKNLSDKSRDNKI